MADFKENFLNKNNPIFSLRNTSGEIHEQI